MSEFLGEASNNGLHVYLIIKWFFVTLVASTLFVDLTDFVSVHGRIDDQKWQGRQNFTSQNRNRHDLLCFVRSSFLESN